MLVLCNHRVGDSPVAVELAFEKTGLMGLMSRLVGQS